MADDMADERNDVAATRAEAEQAVKAVATAASGLVVGYASSWFKSFTKALDGDYEAAGFVSDVAGLYSRLIRDSAALAVLSYEALEKMAHTRARDEAPGPAAEDTPSAGEA
jgi:hypothetical protein